MKPNTQSAFTLIGLVVVIAMAVLFVSGVAYVAKVCADKAKTVAARHEEQLTNGLAEAEWPVALPEQDEWLMTIPSDASVEQLDDGSMAVIMPDETAAALLPTVGSYRIECSTSLAGPWLETGTYTADAQAVRSMMMDMARLSGELSQVRVGFFRSMRE